MTSGPGADYFKRITQYCARSERCTHDVVIKLTSWGVGEEKMNDILESLRLENFLNDARYIHTYVTEKWKQDRWGKAKIKYGLEQKGFEVPVIQKALDIIDQEEYKSGLIRLLMKKRKELMPEDHTTLSIKLVRFGEGRGFERELILQWLEAQGFDLEG